MMAVLTLPFAAHETGEEVGSQAVLGLHTEGVDYPVVDGVEQYLCQHERGHAYAIVYQMSLACSYGDVDGLLAQVDEAQ